RVTTCVDAQQGPAPPNEARLTQTRFQEPLLLTPSVPYSRAVVARDAVRGLTGGLRMPRAWVHMAGHDTDAAPPQAASVNPAHRRQAARLAARERHAEQAGTRAMARSDWIAAAEFEEERVVTQDELAQLLVERAVDARTEACPEHN